MANRRRTEPLDDLEERLTGPKRIGLFGHRNVGKTTLLAMFYRQASTGQVPGIRLAAIDPMSAEYLAEKIAQIESGEPPAGTLAETELHLRLYHDSTRFDLIVKDYQGEHVTLGSDEPIQQFFADCDAVLLCLDPEGPSSTSERRRRQQEVENLLERYIERSSNSTAGLPIALLLTKFDRVRATHDEDLISDAAVERLVESRYGMTRHLLANHAPRSAMFAVSSYGRGSSNGRPPQDLQPLGLEAPLSWLVEELEIADIDRLEWLEELAPYDLERQGRCLAACRKRYPDSVKVEHFERRLLEKKRARGRKRLVRNLAVVAAFVGGLAGFDAWAFESAIAYEKTNSAPMVARRWSDLLTWHPTLPAFWPGRAKVAREKLAEWTGKEAELLIADGDLDTDISARLEQLKRQAPTLVVPALKKVDTAKELARHDAHWKTVRALAGSQSDEPEVPLAAVRAFLRDFPDTNRKADALALIDELKAKAETRAEVIERQALADIERAESLPEADFHDLIERSQQFLADYPRSRLRGEVESKIRNYVDAIDKRDIERARQYSAQYPTNFASRIERYSDYLKAHQAGGRYISEATMAKDEILRAWDTYAYRLAYDYYNSHPEDLAETARRFRNYLAEHRDGGHAKDAQTYIDWFAKVSVPGQYRITIRRGEFDPSIGKYLSGGGPDLDVEIEVAGVIHGPSPVIPNSYTPFWDYTFPRPVSWKLGDPVRVKVTDHDWSDTVVAQLESRKGDPLTIKLLSGPIKPSKGGKTTLVFASDFSMPTLAKPE